MEENKVYEVREAIADPSTVGLASFGIALFTLSFLNAGILGASSVSVIIPLALITGLIHFFACWYGFRKNELFTAIVFGIYGMFWIVFGLIVLGEGLKWYPPDAHALQIFLIAYTIFTFYIWIATWVTNWAVIITVTVLLIVFLLLDFGMATWAGYAGMLDGLLALYVSAAGLLGTMYGRSVLPVGPVKR